MSHDRTVIRHAVEEVGFGFFTDDEIKALSVKRITSPLTFDTMNNPLPGGLYDPALGPVERQMICETCAQDQKNCPGHLGHIELAVSVYHPLLFGAMYKLIRAKCFNCHNLRVTKSKTRVTAVKMMLVEAGRGQEARELDDTLMGYLRNDVCNPDDTDGGDVTESKRILTAQAYRERVLSSLEQELQQVGKMEWCGGHDRTLRRSLVEGLVKSMGVPKKCENCGAVSPGIRKDGFNKLFQTPLSERSKQINRISNTEIKSAVKGRDPGEQGAGENQPGDDSDPMPEDDSEGEGFDLDGGAGGTTVSGSMNPTITSGGEIQGDKFMPPLEVELQMQHLWKREANVLNLLFNSGRSPGADGYKLFFITVLAVPPPRFRPPMNLGEYMAEHPQNIYLSKVLALNEQLKNAGSLQGEDLASALTTWVELQSTVNCFMDSNKDPRGLKTAPPGVKQILEKKEGLFRKHMMGKRVNYACRSVISPDPYLGTTEIGIPLRFAKVLTYPQPVADWNVESLRELVEAGTDSYPGANLVEDALGRLVYLERLSELKRKGVAARLLSTPGQKVWRHLRDGDCMLVNRQPTLHKPGIMAHRVRVLKNPSYQTIRMHYANCNTYNADFDGDEINCHLPQNEVAKAEAHLLAFTDEQYLVPTSGRPLRGLIQDHVDAGVKMCSKNTFFTRGEYQQLVYQALSGLPGLEIVPPTGHIHTLPPAIIKPQELWTGKQVMSTILKHLTFGMPQLNLESKAKTPAVAFGASEQEHFVIFREGELLQGVLDKGAFGATEFGVVHAVHELYGSTSAGKLLTALGRVLTIFLQTSGHTCGIEDLTLSEEAETTRRHIIEQSLGVGQRSMREMLDQHNGIDVTRASDVSRTDAVEPLPEEEVEAIRQDTATFLLGEGRDGRLAEIDRHMQSALAPVSSEIIKACLPQGQEKPFPENCFSLMVLTGGKGSMVNHSQVSCALGQQALEGRRVPVMISGKSLPSFKAFEPSPRANGFITDRFLTGIRPQEYYFHCMAGREGLVDTAVKTSRSGYLQRCLVKHMEELKVAYDNTVRDGEGCVVQFLYGEDGVDTTQTKYLSSKQLGFMAQNMHALKHKYHVSPTFAEDNGFDVTKALLAHTAVVSPEASSKKTWQVGDILLARRKVEGADGDWDKVQLKDGWYRARVTKTGSRTTNSISSIRFEDGTHATSIPASVWSTPRGAHEPRRRVLLRSFDANAGKNSPDPVLAKLNVSRDLGCVSESFHDSLQSYMDGDPAVLRSAGGERIASSSSGGGPSMPSLPEESGGKKLKKRRSEGNCPSATVLDLKEAFELLMWLKYQRSLAAPGEAVGSIAAQSVGEPSTQMTLNTFHLAGHGGANVTLGIPRLREIIMTAARNLQTPSTTVPLREGAARETADSLALKLSRLSLNQLLSNTNGVTVKERIVKGESGLWERHYAINLKTFPTKLIRRAFGINFHKVCQTICNVFIPHLFSGIRAELKRCGERISDKAAISSGRFRGKGIENSNTVEDKGTSTGGGGTDDVEDQETEIIAQQAAAAIKKEKKADAEYETDDEDEEGQGTLTFGKRKEQASYEGMDEEEKAIWKAMSGVRSDALLSDEENAVNLGNAGTAADEDDSWDGDGGTLLGKKGDGTLVLPAQVSSNAMFKGVRRKTKQGELEVTVKLSSSLRRLLMVGIVEAAAAKTMIRSQKGINRAFVVEMAEGGKSGLAVQVEGSCFETIWQLREGGEGILNLDKLTSNDIWAMCETYGVEAARASIMSEITGVFGAYGIQVDPRHLSLVADHMTFAGGYRPMNRSGMADFSSPCLQMSFETTADFMAKAAVAGLNDRLKSPSARIVVGRVGEFGTGMFDLKLS